MNSQPETLCLMKTPFTNEKENRNLPLLSSPLLPSIPLLSPPFPCYLIFLLFLPPSFCWFLLHTVWVCTVRSSCYVDHLSRMASLSIMAFMRMIMISTWVLSSSRRETLHQGSVQGRSSIAAHQWTTKFSPFPWRLWVGLRNEPSFLQQGSGKGSVRDDICHHRSF